MTTIRSGMIHRWKVAGKAFALCLVAGLLLAGCATTGEDGGGDLSGTSPTLEEGGGGFLGLGSATPPAHDTEWIRHSPHSSALEPRNWLDYSAYYLGEIALAPIRIVQMILDGA